MSETQQTPPQANYKITVNAPPSGQMKSSNFAGARAVNEQLAETIRARRAAVHRAHAEEVATRDLPGQADMPTPPPEREDIESIEFTTRDGHTIVYGPPRDISLIDRISRLYAGREISSHEYRHSRILMGVRSIDGKPVGSLRDDIAQTALSNRLGDENLDLLIYYDRLHFPPLQKSEIPVVKKNLRQ